MRTWTYLTSLVDIRSGYYQGARNEENDLKIFFFNSKNKKLKDIGNGLKEEKKGNSIMEKFRF